ncbi:hypothetical protein Mgra_00009339 [Meloidogyne graminicola]|uniref:Uncharacterized protein n=1 Tax=Meloidogyne graminicola TaxID=189291 RepID=A0A8S9ZA27_9BILA|nr:hypothetical protein Mgra_00009339 [Meloidogyne graminicola]
MLFRHQSNKMLFKEVMAVVVLLLIMLQFAFCLRAASKEVESTMEDYRLQLDDSAVMDRVKREDIGVPKCKQTDPSNPDPKGIVALGSFVLFVICLLLMFLALCGCICTDTKFVDVDA